MRLAAAVATMLLGTLACADPIARYDAGGSGRFIDDAYALRPDGKAIAFIVSDGSSATLHLADVGGKDFTVAGAPIDASALYWLGANRVLIVSQSVDPGAETQRAQLFTAGGAGKQQLSGFTRLALANVGNKPVIVTYTRAAKEAVEHTVATWTSDGLKPLKRRSWREDGEGQLHDGSATLKPLWWSDGFTVLAALRAGEYDKAHDVRQPDRFVKIDALSGKILEEHAIDDLATFTKLALLRRDAPNELVLVHWSEDHTRLMLLDGVVDRELKLPRPLAKYDPATLGSQRLDENTLLLSLTIDPVNPEAVARKKADVDDLDFYAIDRSTLAATRRLQLRGEQRRSTWTTAGGRLLLLRKGKGFDRGGVALELYALPSTSGAGQ